MLGEFINLVDSEQLVSFSRAFWSFRRMICGRPIRYVAPKPNFTQCELRTFYIARFLQWKHVDRCVPDVEIVEVHVAYFLSLLGIIEEACGICTAAEKSFSWLQSFWDFVILKELIDLGVHSKLTFDAARSYLDNITSSISDEVLS